MHDHSGCYERCDVSDWMQIGFSGRFLGLACELWFYVATVLGTGNGFNRKRVYFVMWKMCVCVCMYKCVHV